MTDFLSGQYHYRYHKTHHHTTIIDLPWIIYCNRQGQISTDNRKNNKKDLLIKEHYKNFSLTTEEKSKTCGAQTIKFFESKKGIFCTHTQKVICAKFRNLWCTKIKNLFYDIVCTYFKRVKMRTQPQAQKHKTKKPSREKNPELSSTTNHTFPDGKKNLKIFFSKKDLLIWPIPPLYWSIQQ